ncbi:uncharacterized protein LOC106669376 isoform X3 [Cimex lectularius]|uniref:F-box domain-containing protein n=1 Tax=Cimex lectularius TaxID=79782 RepID=A0A8I6SLC7_CIMLE|nr:uncharacterized protein LOC106669376 isoform X3 [Cimex lectularius]
MGEFEPSHLTFSMAHFSLQCPEFLHSSTRVATVLVKRSHSMEVVQKEMIINLGGDDDDNMSDEYLNCPLSPIINFAGIKRSAPDSGDPPNSKHAKKNVLCMFVNIQPSSIQYIHILYFHHMDCCFIFTTVLHEPCIQLCLIVNFLKKKHLQASLLKKKKVSLMDCIPVEILEQIFSYLGLTDLGNCSKVSTEWREIINSNSIWSRLSAVVGIHNKEYLKKSLVYNPLRAFRGVDDFSQRLSPDCHWRSHFKKYKYLEENWRFGTFTVLHTGFKVTYYKDRMVANTNSSNIELFDIDNKGKKMRIPVAHSEFRVDSIFILKEFLIYVQKCYIICMRKNGNTYECVYNIKVKNSKCNHKINTLQDSSRLTLKFTSRYIVILDNKHPCKLFFYNIFSGFLEKEVDVTPEKACIRCHFIKIFEEKVYLTYTVNNNHFISCYDTVEGAWTLTFEIDTQACELTVSRNFICAKISTEPNMKNCELQVWPIQNQEEMYTYFADKHLPIILTSDDKIIFSDDVTVHIQELVQPSKVDYSLKLNGKVVDMMPVMNNLIVINTSMSLQLWDWKKAEQMQTFFRDKVVSMWVDDKTVVLNKFDEQFNGYVLAFW